MKCSCWLLHIRQQALYLGLDHAITLARAQRQLGAVEHGDVPAPIADATGLLQIAGGLGNAFTAYAEHGGDQLLRHYQFAARRSEEHTSELQSLMRTSYAAFCLQKTT